MEKYDKTSLRLIAEEKLKEFDINKDNLNETDLKSLVHELSVHQIELEIQNEELMKTQEELKESNEQYKSLYNFAPIAFIAYDFDSIIIDVNQTAAKLFNQSKEKLIGSDLTTFIEPDYQNNFYFHNKTLQNSMENEKNNTQIAFLIDGEMVQTVFESVLKKSRDNERLYSFTAIADVSQLKKIEHLLIDKNRELKHFTERVSHNLKSYMVIMGGYLQIIKKEPELFEECFGKLYMNTNKMNDYIENLLRLSQAGKIIGKKEIINLNRLFLVHFHNLKPDEIEGEIIIKEKLPNIYADIYSFMEIANCLISNAIKSKKPDEKLIVTVEGREVDNNVIISFSDNGKGLDEKYLEKIFYPGFCLDKSKNSGFGLSIVKKIVQAHGGRIWAELNNSGEGLSIFIEMPVKNEIDKKKELSIMRLFC